MSQRDRARAIADGLTRRFVTQATSEEVLPVLTACAGSAAPGGGLKHTIARIGLNTANSGFHSVWEVRAARPLGAVMTFRVTGALRAAGGLDIEIAINDFVFKKGDFGMSPTVAGSVSFTRFSELVELELRRGPQTPTGLGVTSALMTPANPEAGWYPDPARPEGSRRRRRWNGAAWLHQLDPMEAADEVDVTLLPPPAVAAGRVVARGVTAVDHDRDVGAASDDTPFKAAPSRTKVAGWYPDPARPPGSHRRRRWDGSAWLADVDPPEDDGLPDVSALPSP